MSITTNCLSCFPFYLALFAHQAVDFVKLSPNFQGFGWFGFPIVPVYVCGKTLRQTRNWLKLNWKLNSESWELKAKKWQSGRESSRNAVRCYTANKIKITFRQRKVSSVDVLKEFKKVVQKLLSTHFKISQMCKRTTHTRFQVARTTFGKVLFEVSNLIKRKGDKRAQKLTTTRANNNKWKWFLKGGEMDEGSPLQRWKDNVLEWPICINCSHLFQLYLDLVKSDCDWVSSTTIKKIHYASPTN